MGIRFICHACNKRLNVKAFLAGKRGICPHCGSKVDIPWQSVGADHAEGPAASGIMRQSNEATATNGSMPAGGTSSAGSAATYQATAVPKVPSVAPVDVASAVPVSPVGQTAARATPVGAAGSVPIAATAAPAPPEVHEPPNPIDEAPGAMWYVRPPSGGEYGPASGEIMKKWVGEGRVSADSLVWREGWADWKTASSLFTQLSGAAQSAAPPTPTVAAPSAPFGTAPLNAATTAETGSSRPYVKRRSNNSLAVVMVVLLTLASLGLFGVLIAVIRFMQ